MDGQTDGWHEDKAAMLSLDKRHTSYISAELSVSSSYRAAQALVHKLKASWLHTKNVVGSKIVGCRISLFGNTPQVRAVTDLAVIELEVFVEEDGELVVGFKEGEEQTTPLQSTA